MTKDKKFSLIEAISVFDKEQDLLVFRDKSALADYFNLTPEQLLKWINEDETPWGDFQNIMPVYLVESNKERTSRRRKKTGAENVLSFRVSNDGDHWDTQPHYFTSLPKLLSYLEFYLLENSPIPKDEVKDVILVIEKDLYAKWVSPENKKRKYYILIDHLPTDEKYYE